MSGFRTTRILGAAIVAMLAALSIGGCAPTASTSGASSDAASLVERRCSVCHTLDRVNDVKKDAAGWNSTVDRMRANGAVVSEAEQKVIVAYLAAR